jgi:hypothetical protein
MTYQHTFDQTEVGDFDFSKTADETANSAVAPLTAPALAVAFVTVFRVQGGKQ